MSHDTAIPTDDLALELRRSWHRFIETFEPLRPELYRYCRGLTRSPWDAEDLVQDTLMRAFSTMGDVYPALRNPRAWLLRVASNLWIDRLRRTRELALGELPEPAAEPQGPSDTRAAAAALIGDLGPQERAAVLLKDVFDFRLAEIAEVLGTTTGAVKSALHRGRGKLSDDADPKGAERVVPEVLDAFCDAFNARDVERLTALVLENGSAAISGMAGEFGRDAMLDPKTGSLHHTLFSSLDHAVYPELLEGNRDAPRGELRVVHGEPVMLIWYDHDAGPVVRDVVRFRVEDGRVAHILYHFFSPEVLADVSEELGLPWRSNGYRYVLG
ncbi:MAG: RNA polymerase sigma factor [Myxococcota bacterium]